MPLFRKDPFTTRGCSVRTYAALLRSLSLATILMLVANCAIADSYWQGGTSDFNVAGSWNPSGVLTGVNAINDSGSNNVVLIQPGDPVFCSTLKLRRKQTKP